MGRRRGRDAGGSQFTPAAHAIYTGSDPVVAWDLRLLKNAMHYAGFYGFHPEWWHFMAKDWQKYKPVSAADMPPGIRPFPAR
jgi:D-alanyl-D-alanine dipeptidase